MGDEVNVVRARLGETHSISQTATPPVRTTGPLGSPQALRAELAHRGFLAPNARPQDQAAILRNLIADARNPQARPVSAAVARELQAHANAAYTRMSVDDARNSVAHIDDVSALLRGAELLTGSLGSVNPHTGTIGGRPRKTPNLPGDAMAVPRRG